MSAWMCSCDRSRGMATPKWARVIRKALGCRSSTERIMTVAATPRMAVPATMGTATGTLWKLPHPQGPHRRAVL